MFNIDNQNLHKLGNILLEDRVEFYTVAEFAKLLKVSKSHIYDLINYGELKAFKMSERSTRIPASSIKEFTKLQMDKFKGNNYNKDVQIPKMSKPPKRGQTKCHR